MSYNSTKYLRVLAKENGDVMIPKFIKNLFFSSENRVNTFKKQTFTFFIPSPPPRSTGYREKQFDKLFFEFINRGYDVLDFKCESVNNRDGGSGMWVICLVQATNEAAEELNLDEEFNQLLQSKVKTKDQIEGLYYIDDRANEIK
jgi:hypothetical protein